MNFSSDLTINLLNGSGIYSYDSTTIVQNSILRNNNDSIIKQINLGKVSYSDVMGGYKGVGNFNQNPLFDSLSNTPYVLSHNSPCIDKGNADTTGLFLSQFDIAGNPRIVNDIVDMGVYELQPANNISGTITYNNTKNTPIVNIKVYLKTSEGKIIDSVITNINGYYSFTNVSNGNYYVIPLITKPWGGANPADALIINRIYIGLYKLNDDLVKTASDVNKDNKTNPVDALMVNRRYIGIINQFKQNDWIIDKTGLIKFNGGYMDYNIKAICAGDVDGSYKF